jgi:ribonuclease VapC
MPEPGEAHAERPVLDASAVLALLQNEPGADVVNHAIAGGAAISIVNLAEVLTKLADRGQDPDAVLRAMRLRGGLGAALQIEPLTTADAVEVARLSPPSRKAGLSLGDRCCLALAKRLSEPALTAEEAWQDVPHGVQIRLIRQRQRG